MQALTVTLPTFCRQIGIGRTTAYALIAAGEVEAILVRGRRLVTVESIEHLIERRLVAARTSKGAR